MENKEYNLEKQCVTVTIGGMIAAAVNGIVAFIAVYFFKPVWNKLIKITSNKNTEE